VRLRDAGRPLWRANAAASRSARVRCPSLVIRGAVRVEGLHQPHQSRRAQRDEAKRNEADEKTTRQLPTLKTAEHLGGHGSSLQRNPNFHPCTNLRPHPVAGRAWPQRVAILQVDAARFRVDRASQRKPLFGALDRSAPRSRRLYMTAEFWQAVSRSTTARSPRFRFRRNVWFCYSVARYVIGYSRCVPCPTAPQSGLIR